MSAWDKIALFLSANYVLNTPEEQIKKDFDDIYIRQFYIAIFTAIIQFTLHATNFHMNFWGHFILAILTCWFVNFMTERTTLR